MIFFTHLQYCFSFNDIKMLLKCQTSLWKYSRFSFSNITKYLVIAFYLPGVLWSFFKLKFELSLFVRWDYLSFMSFLLNTSLFGKENAGKSWKFCDFQHTSLFLQIFTLYSLLFIASCSLPTVYNFLYSCLKKTQSPSQVPEVRVCDFYDHSPTINNIHRNLQNQSKETMNNVQTKFVYMSYFMSIYELETHL